MLQGLFNRAGRGIFNFAVNYGGTGLGMRATTALSRNMYRIGASPVGRKVAAGAVLGAGYGAVSSDTSMLGGAMMGAMAGVSPHIYKRGRSLYGGMRGLGAGRGKAATATLRMLGRDTVGLIGNTMTKGYGSIRGFFR